MQLTARRWFPPLRTARSLLAGRRYGAPRLMTQEAQRLVDTILGGQYFERWPDAEYQALLNGRVL